MKNIRIYKAEKYNTDRYIEKEPDIYMCNSEFVTSLCFEQEPGYKEGSSAAEISQYPLEDILDKYCVYISDFFEELNVADSNECYLEFCSDDINDIRRLKSIIGKHVYNKEDEDGIILIIDPSPSCVK